MAEYDAKMDAAYARGKEILDRAAELELIQGVAADVITRTMAEGAKKYAVGEWRTRTDLIEHAMAHLLQDSHEDLEHALIDIALELARQKEAGK